MEFSFEELQRRRVANIQSQFTNAEDLQKAEQEDIEKARHGTYEDNAVNRRLNRVGQEYGKKAEEQQPGQRQKKGDESGSGAGKTVAEHAADTDSKVLQKVVDDPDAKSELKEAAKAELKKRGGEKKEEQRKPMQSKRFTKEDSKQKASESLKSAFSKLEEEYESAYNEDGDLDIDAALAADDKFLKTVHKLIINGGLDKKTFTEMRENNPSWKYGFQGMPSYEEIRDDEDYMSDEEKNSPDFGAKRFETLIQKFLKDYDDVYEDDEFNQDLAEKVDKEFNQSVHKLIKDGKLDEKTFKEVKKKFKSLEYGFDTPSFDEYKNHNF